MAIGRVFNEVIYNGVAFSKSQDFMLCYVRECRDYSVCFLMHMVKGDIPGKMTNVLQYL